MRIEKLDHLLTTGMMEEKGNGKTAQKDVRWANKVAKIRTNDRCSGRSWLPVKSMAPD